MFAAEAKREDGIETVSIATPNFTHYEIAKAALEAGLHVYCEKPMCFFSNEAQELERLAKEKNRIMFLSYGYCGHQMIEQARRMVASGDLGSIRILKEALINSAHHLGASFSPCLCQQILHIAQRLCVRFVSLAGQKFCTNLTGFILSAFP